MTVRKCRHLGVQLDPPVDVGIVGMGQCAQCGAEVTLIEVVNQLSKAVAELRRDVNGLDRDIGPFKRIG